MTEEAAPPPLEPRRRRGWLLTLALLAIALGAAAAYAGWRALPGYIVREAARRGILLEPGELDLHLDRVEFHGARFTLVGVRGLRGELDHAIVELDGRTPRALRAEGLSIALVGDEPLTDLPGWSERFAGSGQPPLEATRVRVGWGEREGAAASKQVVFDDATLSVAGADGKLRGARVTAFGREATPTAGRKLDVAWRTAPRALAIGLGSTSVAGAPITIDLRGIAASDAPEARPQLRIAIAPLPLDELVAAATPALEQRALPPDSPSPPAKDARKDARPIVVEGWAELPLPRFDADEKIEGKLRLTVRGWVPPHPRELDGILFGDTTEIASSFVLPATRDVLELPDLDVTAGALRLAGSGAVRRSPEPTTRANVRADLSGSLPCTALARSAASARLGDVLGDLAGDLAARTLAGSVRVRVTMAADLDHLDAARIDPVAEVQCKLALR